MNMTPPPFLSASLISNFERCPYTTIRSQRNQFNKTQSIADSFVDNAPMQYGTDFHGVMETLQEFENDSEGLLERLEVLFGEEAGDVLDSIHEIKERDEILGRTSIGNELEFGIWEPSIGVTITGHIDELLVSESGKVLTIRDFKTGRLYESAVSWTNRIQPRMYNYAVRHEDFRKQYALPEFEEYYFEICYPRQNATTSWKLSPETPALLGYIRTVWESMKEMYSRGFAEGDPTKYYPQILNEYCRNCSVRSECEKYQNLTHLQVLPESPKDETLVQAFLRLQNLAKIIEGELDSKKSQVRGLFEEGSKRLDLEGHTFALQSRNETVYSAADVLHGLLQASNVDLSILDFNKLFDVSNTEVRKLIKEYPWFAEIFDAARTTKPGNTWLRYAGTKDRHQ